MLAQLSRQIAFALQVPPRQIARRLALIARRRFEERLKPALDDGAARMADDPPLPLFAPRRELAARSGAGWRFRFVGHEATTGHLVDWRLRGPPGLDQLWRMNLHYMEYLEELPDTDVIDLIDQWIAANPPYRRDSAGDAWNAYAMSLRIVVWMQLIAQRRAGLPQDFIERALTSLARQTRYLERHLETDIGGNHLIKNIKALAWASRFFTGESARRWGATARKLLDRELGLQMLPDGMHFERSPSYHCQIIADLAEIRHALGSDPCGGKLDRALHKGAQVGADLCHPDGRVAQFSDSGLTMAYGPDECLDAIAKLSGRKAEPSPVFAFGDAGYFGVRDGDSYAVMDAGPIAPSTLPAHGHGDMLAIEWSLKGHRIIVDQGVFQYLAGEKRHASRSAMFHNTLCIEGLDQAQFFGAFRSAGRARLLDRSVERDGDVLQVAAGHDGFRRGGGPVHYRRARLSPRHIRIEDRLDGQSSRPARIAFLLHPAVRTEQVAAGKVRLTCGKAAALVAASADLAVEPAVWWPDMGVELATSRLVMVLRPGEVFAWVEIGAEKESAREAD